MPSFHDVFFTLNSVTTVAVAIATGAAYVLRGSITAWLTRRLGRGLERDAEQYKHELARDMERYKDELTRAQNVDRFKSEMHKAVAERMLERQLQAFHDVSVALQNGPSYIVSVAVTGPGNLEPTRTQLEERVRNMEIAINTNALYFQPEFRHQYLRMLTATTTVKNASVQGGIFEQASPQIVELLTRAVTVDSAIGQAMRELPSTMAAGLTEPNGGQPGG
jgi:hypothetical protein